MREFGTKRENEERRDGGCTVVFDTVTKKFAAGKRDNGHLLLFAGGIEEGEDTETGALRELTEESGLHNFARVEKIDDVICHFYNSRKNINRVAHATCFLVVLKDTDVVPTKLEEHEDFVLCFVSADELFSNWKARNEDKGYDHWIYFLEAGITRLKELNLY